MTTNIKHLGEIKNAIIDNVSLGIEDHGILTMHISVKYDGGGQGFGGYALDSYDREKKRRVGTAYGAEFILRIIDTLKVYDIFKLKGTPIRVDACDNKIYGIGHLLEDRWFYPDELTAEYRHSEFGGYNV